MRAIKFKQATTIVAENQPEYQPLPAYHGQLGENESQTGLITCFELSDEEIDNVKKYGKIWHSQLTFGAPMQPIQMFCVNDLFDNSKDNEPVNNSKSRKRIDIEKLPEKFRNLSFGNTPQTEDTLYLYKGGNMVASIRTSKEHKVWDFYVDNFPGNKQFYRQGIPYYSYEQFRLDCERIGIDLTYISDEED